MSSVLAASRAKLVERQLFIAHSPLVLALNKVKSFAHVTFKYYQFGWHFYSLPACLLDYRDNYAGAYGAATLADGEPQADFHRDRRDKLYG